MRYAASQFGTGGIHPSAVYAESDLAVAFIGTLDGADPHISARVVIWPEKKQYNRVYGDAAIAGILRGMGYSPASAFEGAHIRCIESDGDGEYVMPYLDCGDSVARVTREGRSWFRILAGGEGEYSARETTGVAGAVECFYCSRCEAGCDEDESLCTSCREDAWSCDACGGEYFNSNESSIEVPHYQLGSRYLCDSCASEESRDCLECNETYYGCAISPTGHRDRLRQHTDEHCPDCGDGHWYCAECQTLHDMDDVDLDECPVCTAREQQQARAARVATQKAQRGYTIYRRSVDYNPREATV
jgi:hypothetical protein